MLKTIRIILAVLSIFAVTLLFVDFTGTAQALWPWMAKIQLMPAILSANVLALAFIFLLTIVFGRVYCSVICPLGIFQDIVNWMRNHVGSKSSRLRRLGYSQAWTRTRLVFLSIFVVFLILGLTNVLAAMIAGLIEPYSAYGRIASQVFAPIVAWINNFLAGWSESQVDNYAFYRVAAGISIPVLSVAIVTLIVIVVMSWRGGRDYCNTVCPVGTILGYLSRWSLLKPVIDTSKCINCGKCARGCKAKCIDAKAHDIDYSRCVACMDCISTCSEGAISYTWRKPSADNLAPRTRTKREEVKSPEAMLDEVIGNTSTEPASAGDAPDASRRGFVIALGALAGAAAVNAVDKTTDGGLTPLKPKQPVERATKVLPAGAISHAHLNRHCTACQLCIQSCPSHVLKPSTDINGFMQPVLDYTEGYCSPACTVCSSICPVGAFHPIDEVEKSSIKVGTAVVDIKSCISATEGENCGSCATHCPAGAIRMDFVSEDSDNLMPIVNAEACIGCGACEYYCPAGTVESMSQSHSAIHVQGIQVHREI